ncbi:hypothetical protein [Falsiroseomonas tokyonensis]|uniref:AI-2E family transporter n=1 Tax=Falsiroseomonas tokyonensis TaxID=430521 RepID=A0ABV7BT38_9PROT|nr:hypothetical protein [Falsiroseomonas tokyonensis]MBU8538808.1 hypothetical protein [Falsiroseomonas tokyonensis]
MATSPAARRSPRPRAASGGARPRAKAAAPPRLDWLTRWWKVALLVALVTIGLPVAHALFGEVIALLGGAVLFGFLLGRWTAGL